MKSLNFVRLVGSPGRFMTSSVAFNCGWAMDCTTDGGRTKLKVGGGWLGGCLLQVLKPHALRAQNGHCAPTACPCGADWCPADHPSASLSASMFQHCRYWHHNAKRSQLWVVTLLLTICTSSFFPLPSNQHLGASGLAAGLQTSPCACSFCPSFTRFPQLTGSLVYAYAGCLHMAGAQASTGSVAESTELP